MLKVANSVISASRITGVLPVANGGTGVTTSTGTGNTVLSASPTLSGDVAMSTGNLVISTAGKGIDFSATTSGSGTMTSELLADYEEGTWTPTVTCSTSGTVTFVSPANTGKYTKVGNLVTLTLNAQISLVSAPVGYVIVGGFPFTSGVSCAATWNASGILNTSPHTATIGVMSVGATDCYWDGYLAGSRVPMGPNMTNGAYLNFAISYQV